MKNIIDYIESRISHAEKRVVIYKEGHGENPEQTYNYFGGHHLGYWEGKLSTLKDILDSIEKENCHMNQDSIVSIQSEIINEYQATVTYFNKTFMDIIRLHRGRLYLTEVEVKLVDFAWTCNDMLVDNTKLYSLLYKLDELKKGVKND